MESGTRRILVVDDDPGIRVTLSQVLGDEGYEVMTAASGREALRTLRAGPRPQVILLDLLMPDMNGWEFCAEWRGDPASARIPLLVFSASREPLEALEEMGAAGLIPKPICLERLLDLVEGLCRA